MQCIEQRLGVLLPDGLALIGAELFYLTLDVVDLGECSSAKPASWLLFAACRSKNLRQACARQPASVTPLAIKAL